VARVQLPYIQTFRDRFGKVRYYFRRTGFERVALPGKPGSAEFLAAYYAASGVGPKDPKSRRLSLAPTGSISALLCDYYQSAEFQRLKLVTQTTYRRALDGFAALELSGTTVGKLPVARLERRHILQLLDRYADKPGASEVLMKRLRTVLTFAVDRGWIASNPATRIRSHRKSEGFTPWSEEDVDQFAAHWPEGSKARLALALLLYTGQRRSDVVGMGRPHLRGDLLQVVQQKTKARLAIPVHPALKLELDRLPPDQLTFLLTEHGKPFSVAGFGNWFGERAREAGLTGRTAHGLRKAAARRLAEAGCSAHEIMAITGHQTLAEAERYTRSANQITLARSAIRAIT